MPSPFPGMDPWLERPMLFPGVHADLIHHIKVALNAALPPGFVATTANRVWVDAESRREPDVSLFGRNGAGPHPGGGGVATLAGHGLLAVATAPFPADDPIEEPYLEILSEEDERLVTAVEVLSLSNKRPGDGGRTTYLAKQVEYRAGGVNLVEIDLLRAGPHTTAVPEDRLRAVAGRFDYHVAVMEVGAPTRFYAAPVTLEAPLPTIPVPLGPGVTPVRVDLQALFARLYDEGGYAKLAKYATRPPDPPLTPEQAAWAAGVLRAKGVLPPTEG